MQARSPVKHHVILLFGTQGYDGDEEMRVPLANLRDDDEDEQRVQHSG